MSVFADRLWLKRTGDDAKQEGGVSWSMTAHYAISIYLCTSLCLLLWHIKPVTSLAVFFLAKLWVRAGGGACPCGPTGSWNSPHQRRARDETSDRVLKRRSSPCWLFSYWQTKDGVNEIIEAVVWDLQADVGAVKRRSPLHLGHLMKVSTDQRHHLRGQKGQRRFTAELKCCEARENWGEKKSVTLTTISFFSKGFPSGNFSPKHMLMV